jgi:hypothetical protein
MLRAVVGWTLNGCLFLPIYRLVVGLPAIAALLPLRYFKAKPFNRRAMDMDDYT